MSVSSSFNNQSVADQIIYESDGSDQHWSPDTSAQSTQPAMTIQWPGVRQYDNTSFNTSEAVYNVQNTGPVENPNYFNMQNNSALSNREYMDLSYQRRDCPVGNGYYVSNGNVMNTPNNGYNNNIMHTPRNGPVYTNQYQHAPRPNWNTNKVSNGGVKKPKRIRTAFTTQQMMELELEYARTRYLDRNRRIELSETLQLSEKTIKVWFQNRRMKDKKDRAEGVEDSEATSTTESSPEMNVQIPQYNYHQNVHGGYNQGSVYHERQSIPMSTLNTSAMPVPVHNALVNSYPGYYTPNVMESNVANTVTLNQSPFQSAEIKQDEEEIVTSVFFADQIECKEVSVIENDGSCIEESSPQSDKVTKELQKASISGENWELSWVRIMNLQEEM